MGRIKYLVPGYNMDQEDIDSLAAWVMAVQFTEYDNMYIMPVQRNKQGKRINLN